MAHFPRKHLAKAYKKIREASCGTSSSSSILILAAPTIDSLCALKIFTVFHNFS